MLGKRQVLGRPASLDNSRTRAYVLAVGADGGSTCFLSSVISFLSPYLWKTARYRLKHPLRGPLNQNKQPIKIQCSKAKSKKKS